TVRGAAAAEQLRAGDWRRLELGTLPLEDARALAVELMHHVLPTAPSEKTEARALAIAEEAAGHPLFIDELVCHSLEEEAPAQLDRPAQRRCHERLAVALEAESPPDLEALAVHWRDAGQPAKAAEYAAQAAAQAAQALAFAQAVRLLRMALDLDPKCAQLGKR